MLDALFNPRSIAIVGASNNPFSIGHIVIQNLVDHGYRGPIFPINPKEKQIKSFKAYPSVLDIPDEVDLVNISIRNIYVPKVIEDCGKKGVKFAIVHTAGFKEVGEEGLKLEQEMVEIAHRYGMRVYGPNSQGVQNSDPSISLYANFTFVPMTPGNVSILAQSGGVGEVLKIPLYKLGMGLRMYASFGNECDVSMNEILEHYGKDEGTRVIMLQVETFKDPKGFLEVARKITPHKPILAIKAGRTKEGAVAVSSHTGSLMDQDTMADAMFEKAGVLRFYSQDDMCKAAIAFAHQPAPSGNKVAIVTNTGGPGILALDEAILGGLELAKLEDSTKDHLRKSLHPEATVKNPVDVVATATPDHYGLTVEALFKDPNVDMVLVNFITAPFVDLEGIAQRLKQAGEVAKKPVVCVVMTIEKWYGLMNSIRASGTPVYDFPEDGGRVLLAMAKYGKVKSRKAEKQPDIKVDREKVKALLGRYEGKDTYLPQADLFAVLESYGIPVSKTVAVKNAGDLKAAAATTGFPCVLKVDSASVVHKSDAGGVVLNLRDQSLLDAAFDAMARKFKGDGVSFVLQSQKPAGREVILGAKAQQGLEPLVMFGLGGIFVEAMKDVVFRLAPLVPGEARSMIRAINGFPVLEGTRGMPPVDMDGLCDMLVRLSTLAADFPVIEEIDLNPVFAYDKGTAPVAVDARLRVMPR
ncbi:MAG: acetate--CoA ligase family protein [Planctomycetota bacterium]